jgi:serine/threonine protein kinase/tetratricopeptide (TPR) repeat protein
VTLTAGSKLGPYEVLAPLGAGGMGEVYRARDTRLAREVAVKVLPAGFVADADRLRRFEVEARSVSALNHPNIVTIHDVGTQDGAPYVVWELLEGETLRQRLASGPLPARKAVDYGLQIARGLAAAHEKGIVHRDLKPENLFVTRDERIKILDFGLAKAVAPAAAGAGETAVPTEAPGTEPGVVMGTMGYMSPEQVRGQAVDQRSDVFALGAILYEMLSGRLAFQGASAADTMSAILGAEPPELSAAGRTIPPALDRTVRHCLEKSPQARFQAAGDVAFALEEVSGGAPSPPTTTAGSPPRRRRVGLLAAAGGAAVLIGIGVFAIRPLRERLLAGAPAAPIRSIAVLPLDNFSKDPDQEYFADGMTEELITDLSQIGSLRVISRTSAMTYKGTKKRVPEIGRELGVDAVLEGSVQKSGGRVRITAQLVRAATDQHLWAKSYERDLRDVLALQTEVARAVAGEIRATLTPTERARLNGARPVDPEVQDLYLQGRYHLNQAGEPEIRKAIACFEQVLEKEPGNARACSGIADAWLSLSDFYVPPWEAMPKARDAARKAVALDETLAEAHASLGAVLFNYDWKWAEAEAEFRRAIGLNAGYAEAHHWYGNELVWVGRTEEGLAEIELAVRLDPRALFLGFDAGLDYFVARKNEQALDQFRRLVAIDPGFGWAHTGLGLAFQQLGQPAQAAAEAEKGIALDDSPLMQATACGVLAASGERDRAREVLARLVEVSRTRYLCPYEIGIVHLNLGDRDAAYRSFEKGFHDRSICMPLMKFDPRLDSIRSDPRYLDLVRRMGFPS